MLSSFFTQENPSTQVHHTTDQELWIFTDSWLSLGIVEELKKKHPNLRISVFTPNASFFSLASNLASISAVYQLPSLQKGLKGWLHYKKHCNTYTTQFQSEIYAKLENRELHPPKHIFFHEIFNPRWNLLCLTMRELFPESLFSLSADGLGNFLDYGLSPKQRIEQWLFTQLSKRCNIPYQPFDKSWYGLYAKNSTPPHTPIFQNFYITAAPQALNRLPYLNKKEVIALLPTTAPCKSSNKTQKSALIIGQRAIDLKWISEKQAITLTNSVINHLTSLGVTQIDYKPHPKGTTPDFQHPNLTLLKEAEPAEQRILRTPYRYIISYSSSSLLCALLTADNSPSPKEFAFLGLPHPKKNRRTQRQNQDIIDLLTSFGCKNWSHLTQLQTPRQKDKSN